MDPDEIADLFEQEWRDTMTLLRTMVDVEYGAKT